MVELRNEMKTPKPKFRYYCQACTGNAMFAVEPVNDKIIVCVNCGSQIKTLKENWIRIAK